MTYCELTQNTKKRTCRVTKNASQNSTDCEYDSQAKKCYVKKNNKAKPVQPQPQPQPPVVTVAVGVSNPNPSQAGPSSPRYCKLSSKPSAKKRVCSLTYNANEDSKECVFDTQKKTCYVNKKKDGKQKQNNNNNNNPVVAPQVPIIINPNPNQAGPSSPRYCRLDSKPGSKRRSCKLTYNANEDSSECKYDIVKRDCFVNKAKPATGAVNHSHGQGPSTVVHQPNNNIQVNTLKTVKNKTEYRKWINKINATRSSFVIEKNKPTGNSKPTMNPVSMKTIARKDVPDDAISLVTYMSYNEDDDYKNTTFYKLDTCTNCPNEGIFAVNDLDSMLQHGYHSCPLCQELYNLSNIPNKPPFGKMVYNVYKYGNVEWHRLTFTLHHESYSRTQQAYYPKCEEGDLALWLICEAWKMGKLFTMGTSVTNGAYGIVFSGIHLRTNISGGVTNHGYSTDPKKDMKQVLTNLINECNAFNIFTPSQLDDFAGIEPDSSTSTMTRQKAATLIKKLLLKRQIDKSDLRKQHKYRLINLPRMDYFMVQMYPTSFLGGLINFRGAAWKQTESSILTKYKGRVSLHRSRIGPLKKIYANTTRSYQDMNTISEKDVPKDFLPKYIWSLSNIIREFPRATKPFYVYRGAYISERAPSTPHYSVNPMPFSTSMNAWLAINFAGLKQKACCLYRIQVNPNVPCIILGDTLFDTLKNENKVYGMYDLNVYKGDLSKHVQYEVLLGPGILKEKSRKVSYEIRDQDEYNRLNKTLFHKGVQKYFPPYDMSYTGVLMIDMEYTPLYPRLIPNNVSEYDIFQ